MSKSNVFVCFSVGVVAAVVSGCASNPSKGDLMRDHRSEVQIQAQAEGELQDQLARDWDRGQELIESGNNNIADGEKRIEAAKEELKRGKEQVEQGKRELAEGKELVQTSERGFRDAFDSDLEGSGDR